MSGTGPHARQIAGRVIAVCASPRHGFAKQPRDAIELLEGLGVKHDAHCGATVRHLFDARRDPQRPNLRQLHLIGTELLDALNLHGLALREGSLGENITSRGIELDALPLSTQLHLGSDAIVAVTGLRDPCIKMDRYRRGLRTAVTAQRPGIRRFTRGGVMAVVVKGGIVRAGDRIEVELPECPYVPLALV